MQLTRKAFLPTVSRCSALTAAAAFAMLCLSAPLRAQDKELSWPAFNVVAHLDADGRLHVLERQTMRFTGDWNGGERRFSIPFGQDVTLDSIVRVDSTKARHVLTRGDLSAVDEYDWSSSENVRWRSRLPDDPPFLNTSIVYELFIRYDGILESTRDHQYRLNHNFAFANRSGNVERFTLDLTIDSAWQAPATSLGITRLRSFRPARTSLLQFRLPAWRLRFRPASNVQRRQRFARPCCSCSSQEWPA